MQDETLLMMPGPVPMPQRVRMAMARQAINHRGAEFGECLKDLNRMLKPMFGTENDIMVISGSGTAAMEASVANFCAGKKVASLVNGKFENLWDVLDDRVHQPYRTKLIEGFDLIEKKMHELEFDGLFISGAGPTLMGVLAVSAPNKVMAMKEFLDSLDNVWRLESLSIDKEGVKIL